MDFLNSETEKQHYREHSQSLTCLIHNEAYANAGGVGQTNVGDFRQITGYISKTVKDRHIVSIKIE